MPLYHDRRLFAQRGFGAVRAESFTYSSTIAAISNLFARVVYPEASGCPVAVLMHGWNQQASDFTAASLERIARLGLFVVVPGMRGRDGASGTADAGLDELQDIIDAVSEARLRYPGASRTGAAIIGYSGGGGNAISCASRFPSVFQVCVDHFGVTDYAAWWSESAADQALLESRIGGTPAAVPANYAARLPVTGLENFTGKLFLYHDQGDTRIPSTHMDRVVTYLAGFGKTVTSSSLTTTGNDPRWLHNLPDPDQPVRFTERYWAPAVRALA